MPLRPEKLVFKELSPSTDVPVHGICHNGAEEKSEPVRNPRILHALEQERHTTGQRCWASIRSGTTARIRLVKHGSLANAAGLVN